MKSQDPRTHPDIRQRHNPNAWKEHSIPPTPLTDLHDISFRSWRAHDNPMNAMHWHHARANGILAFVCCALRQWDEQVFSLASNNTEPLPMFEMDHSEVIGLIEVLGVIGESLDLAKNAAEAVRMDEGKKPTS